MPTLMTFGDSNTYGAPPIVTRGVREARYGADTRWPRVCRDALGEGWDLVEEGLPGRTAQFPDPVMGAHMDGAAGLKIALESHGPVDVLTLMLGTNDVKARFAPTPERVTAGLAGLFDIALSLDNAERHPRMRILLICPPPVLEQGPIAGEFTGGRAVSLGLPPLYRALAAARGAAFLDAGEVISVSPQDGVHYEAGDQRRLGGAVAEAIRAL